MGSNSLRGRSEVIIFFMALSSRTQAATQAPSAATFQWTGANTPEEYYGNGLSSRKIKEPVPVPVSGGSSSRSGEGQTVLSAQQPQEKPVVATPEPQGPLTVEEAQKRLKEGQREQAVERAFGPFRSLSQTVTKYTPVGGALLRRAKNIETQKKQEEELFRQNPELATAKKGDGILGSVWKNSAKSFLELGLDLSELSNFIIPVNDYATVKRVYNGVRRMSGLPEEPEVGGRLGAAAAQTREALQTVGGYLTAFKDSGVKIWQISKMQDSHEKDLALGQWTQDLIDGTAGAATLGVATKIQNAQGFSSDENGVYYQGEKIRDLTPGEKTIQGAGKTAGSVIGSMIAWKVLSPFAGKQVLKAFPTLTKFAVKHPYLYQISAANLAEESLQFAVSKTFNIPYTLGDTFTGVLMQFGFESFNLGRAKLGEMGGKDIFTGKTPAPYDPLGLRAEQARRWQSMPEEMRNIDFEGARTQLDGTVKSFLDQNGRIPTELELQEIVGPTAVPVQRGAKPITWNDLHVVAAREWMTRSGGGTGEGRLIELKGGKRGREGIDRPSEPPKPIKEGTRAVDFERGEFSVGDEKGTTVVGKFSDLSESVRQEYVSSKKELDSAKGTGAENTSKAGDRYFAAERAAWVEIEAKSSGKEPPRVEPKERARLLEEAMKIEKETTPFDDNAPARDQEALDLRRKAFPEVFESKLPEVLFDDAPRVSGLVPFSDAALRSMGKFGKKIRGLQERLLADEKNISSSLPVSRTMLTQELGRQLVKEGNTKRQANAEANRMGNLDLARRVVRGGGYPELENLLKNYEVLRSLHEGVSTTARRAQESGKARGGDNGVREKGGTAPTGREAITATEGTGKVEAENVPVGEGRPLEVIRQSEEGKPSPNATEEATGLSSQKDASELKFREAAKGNGKTDAEITDVLQSLKNIAGDNEKLYVDQLNALTKRQAQATGRGEKSKLSSRQPRPIEQTQPGRSSRLRERLSETRPGETIAEPTKANIVKFLEEQFTAPIRTGKFRQKALGIFKGASNVVRTKAALDLDTASHEIGHYLDSEYGIFRAVKSGSRYLEPYRAELLRMGEETSRPSYDTKKKIKEGIAEFVRRYVMDPESLNELAPNFRTYFEGAMPAEALRIFNEARAANARWMAESPEYRVKSHISTEPPRAPLAQRARQAVDAVFSAIDDDMLAIRKYVQNVEGATGKEILYKEDPYVLARLTRGLDGKTLQWIAPNLKPFDGQGRPLENVRSLGTILQDVGGRRADFEAYLVSKRAQDLHQNEIRTGIAVEDAASVVQIMEARHSDFPALQKEVVGWNRALLQYAQERGFLSSEQVKSMTENGDNYVPFFRVIDEVTSRGKGKKLVDITSPFKRMKGSTRQIVSPIESMTKNAYVIMSAVDRNRVGQALVRLAKLHPDLGAHIEEIPAASRPVTVDVEAVVKQLGMDEQLTDSAAKTITLFVHGNKPNAVGENVVMVIQNGKPKYYSVDPFLYKAIANLSTENAGILIKLLAKPASLLRAGATLTPEFMGRNPIRDQFTAFIYSRGNYLPFVDFGKGLMETITKGEDYQRAAIGGAMQANFVSLDRPSLKQYVDGMFVSRGKKIENYLLHPLDGLRALSELGELGTRVGEARKVFRKEMARTGDYEEALTKSAFAARNVTLDFGRKGWAGKSMNMITAFWNATVQDITKFGRELGGLEKGSRPGMTAIKAITALTVPSIAFYEMSKNDERYKELPRWQKDYFWVVALPGVPLVRIPKPFLPGMIFGSLPVRMLEAMESKSLRPLQEFFVSLRENTIPGLIPTAMQPILEYATNYSFFFGRQIIPQDEIRLLPADQYGIYTSETYKTIGKALNLSPRKIEALVYGYTAGIGRYASEALDFAGGKAGLWEGKPPAPADITQFPVVRAFTISDLSTTGQSISDFYDLYKRAEETYMSFKNAFDTGNQERGKEILQENLADFMFLTPDGKPQLLWAGLGAAADTLSTLKKEREKVIASTDMTPEAKAASIANINSAMRLISRNAIDATRNRPKDLQNFQKMNP